MNGIPPGPRTNGAEGVDWEMSLGGKKEDPGQSVPPPGVEVFQSGRDVGNVSIRMELIEGRLKAEASDAQMTERVVKVPGAAEAAVIESIYPQVPSKQLDLVIGTASGPQYSIRYGAQRSAYDEASAQRIVSSARISGGGV